MSLDLKIQVCSSCNCSELKLSELTGISSEWYTGGYGDSNIGTENVNTAVLNVTRGDGELFNINIFNLGHLNDDPGHPFPTSNSDFVYIISNEDIGYTTDETIPDQILTFEYVITGFDGRDNPFTYNTTIYVPITCTVKCCVMSMVKDIDWSCDCSQKKIDDFLQAWALYQGLLANANCGDINAFNKDLILLNKLCGSTGCGCN